MRVTSGVVRQRRPKNAVPGARHGVSAAEARRGGGRTARHAARLVAYFAAA